MRYTYFVLCKRGMKQCQQVLSHPIGGCLSVSCGQQLGEKILNKHTAASVSTNFHMFVLTNQERGLKQLELSPTRKPLMTFGRVTKLLPTTNPH